MHCATYGKLKWEGVVLHYSTSKLHIRLNVRDCELQEEVDNIVKNVNSNVSG
jgi:hypothetical protein